MTQSGVPEISQVGIRDVTFGERVKIVQPSNLYGCNLGDDVLVGPFVEIQNGAVVGARTRIQSHAFICEGVTIGKDCFVSHGVAFVNDTFKTGGPARGNKRLWKNTIVGNGVSIGTSATVLPVLICDNVVIGAGSTVTQDISVPGIYAGNPARLFRRM